MFRHRRVYITLEDLEVFGFTARCAVLVIAQGDSVTRAHRNLSKTVEGGLKGSDG